MRRDSTVTSFLPPTKAFRCSMASSLLASTPMTALLRPKACIRMRTPPMTFSPCSSISRWSAVMYGSHSAPLRISVSTLPRPELIFTWVGKPAPPIPVIPASLTISTISLVVSLV